MWTIKQFLAALLIFASVFGFWAMSTFVVATLASYLPVEAMVVLVAGGVSLLGMFVAMSVAARLVGRMLRRNTRSG
jgi:hypothetical protein